MERSKPRADVIGSLTGDVITYQTKETAGAWERKRPESSRVGVINLTNISQIGEACEAHGASLASDKRRFSMTVSVKRRVPVPF